MRTPKIEHIHGTPKHVSDTHEMLHCKVAILGVPVSADALRKSVIR